MPEIAAYVKELLEEPMYGTAYHSRIGMITFSQPSLPNAYILTSLFCFSSPHHNDFIRRKSC